MILEAAISLGGLGLLFSLCLGLASKRFYVEVDPRVGRVIEVLPGANCGACGCPGCSKYAEHVVMEPEVPANLCIPGGGEVAKEVGHITGKEVEETGKKRAFILCSGSKDRVAKSFNYQGIEDCRAALLLFSGNKSCPYGCLGFGTCVNACPFEAIEINELGLPVIDKERCTGCGRCKDVCPKGIIEIYPKDIKVYIACSNKDKGKVVKDICAVGCIGCSICAKRCESGAIEIKDNLPKISYDKCTQCKDCVGRCPQGSMVAVS
ncbi:MAG: Fe-S cluster domain-containing protein [bacterium]|nr:Fe-S cluster domain-containing protein [bacterium]